MKVKFSLSLLVAISLSAGLVFAQQPAPPATPPAPEPFERSFSFFVEGGGFLGVYAEDINRENMGRYNLNQPRGVGVTQVSKDSPAEKAGLRKDDVILRLDGENITSVRKLNRLVSELAPDHSVKLTISRGGAEQELTATIGKRSHSSTVQGLLNPENPRAWRWEGPLARGEGLANNDGNLAFMLGSRRRIGISTMELTKQLADYFGVTGGKGVLVTAVSEDGPAAKSGLKAGDVITAIDGEVVDSPGDLSRVISRKKEGDVSLTVIRNRSQQTIRVTPREGNFSGVLDRADGGRRIVIPRIEIPVIPDLDISMPRIEIPAMPTININLPRVRISRSVYGPI